MSKKNEQVAQQSNTKGKILSRQWLESSWSKQTVEVLEPGGLNNVQRARKQLHTNKTQSPAQPLAWGRIFYVGVDYQVMIPRCASLQTWRAERVSAIPPSHTHWHKKEWRRMEENTHKPQSMTREQIWVWQLPKGFFFFKRESFFTCLLVSDL